MAGKYEKYIVRKPINVNELPDHDLSQVIPYPVLMGNELVPEARAWVLYLYIKEITEALKKIAIKGDRATPHMHDYDEMYLMIGDEKAITFEVMLGDEFYEVSTPSAVYIPKNTPHAIRPVDATVGLTGGLIPVCLNGRYVTKPVEKG